MKVLILGGTVFLGRAMTEAALAAGHEVTLFNRGQSNPDLFPDVEKLQGDRDGGLSVLEGRKWDVVMDPSGYVPRLVKASAELLADHVEHYTFISSISVYSHPIAAGTDETAEVAKLEDETSEELTNETYGALKALCEQAAESAMPGRVNNVRAGLIVGPHDRSDRFTYWPVRIARGGETLVPPLDTPVQIIDVRDLAAWCLRMAEARKGGVYNVTGPALPLNLGDVVDACQAASGNKAELIEATEEFLTQHEVAPWTGLPLWLTGEIAGMSKMNVKKAINDGLTLRPLDDTVQATLNWFNAERTGEAAVLRTGIDAEKEAEVIAAWKKDSHNG